MAVEVVHEPKEVTAMCQGVRERCCICRAPTRYWYRPNDVALCELCAQQAAPENIPSKAEWFRKGRAA